MRPAPRPPHSFHNALHQRHGLTLMEVMMIVAFIAGLFVIVISLRPSYEKYHLNNNRALCQNNLKQLALALHQYASDYDGIAPPVALGSQGTASMEKFEPAYGWADALLPYHKNLSVYQCPVEPNSFSGDPTKDHYTDYWFNCNLSGGTLRDLRHPMRTLMLGEGNDGTESTDARYNLDALCFTSILAPYISPSRYATL